MKKFKTTSATAACSGMRNSLARLALILIGALPLAACGGSASDSDQPAVQPAVQSPGAEDSGRAPQGISPELWAELTAELARVIEEEGTAKRTSAVPTGSASMVQDFRVYSTGGVNGNYQWSYRQQGDYDINGLVTIADLTPIGVHFGKRFGESDWQQAQLADGDNNGEVNIADVTPIGQNFGGRIDGYAFQRRNSAAEEFETVEDFPYVAPDPGLGLYREFVRPFSGLQIVGWEFRAVPYVDNGGGNFSYGVPSNVYIVGQTGRSNWPTHRANNNRNANSRTSGPQSKTELWEYEISGQTFFYCNPVNDLLGHIYIPSFGGDLFGGGTDSVGYLTVLDRDGTLLWSRTFDHALISTPSVSPMGDICVGDFNGTLWTFSPDGKLLWSTDLAANVIFTCPLQIRQDTYVISNSITSNFAALYKINQNGGVEWSQPMADSVTTSPMATAEGNVIVADDSGNAPIYDSDGNLLATPLLQGGLGAFEDPMLFGSNLIYGVDTPAAVHSTPFGIGVPLMFGLPHDVQGTTSMNSLDQVVVSSGDSSAADYRLHLLNPALGEIWNMGITGQLLGTLITDSDDNMYFTTINQLGGETLLSEILCVRSDQTILFSYKRDDSLVMPMLIPEEGRLLVGVTQELGAPEQPTSHVVMLGDA